MKLFTIILFAVTYILMIALPKKRPYVALISAVIFVVSGAMPLASVFTAIDWNVLLMLAGTMGTVALFIESKMPERMADLLLQKTPNVMWVAVALSVFAGVVSAFVDNVATVLMIAPVALSIAKKLKMSPVALLICIAVSSNLQGAATLVGDTTSIMLGGYANMDFLDFIVMDGKCSIFFAVELGALVTVPVIMFIFRKEKGKVTVGAPTVVEDLFPTYLLVGTVVLLIAASFIPGRPALTNGLICMTLFLIGLMSAAWTDLRRRQIYDLSGIVIAGAGLIHFSPARLLGLALAVPFWLASRRGRGGMGDALLIAASGFLLGFLRGVAGLVLALVLYCLFYLAIAALHKIRRQERPPESYPFAPFLAVGFFTAYII